MVKRKYFWSKKPAVYRTCTFQGAIEDEQTYLHSVTEEILKLGWKRVDEVNEHNPYLKESDRMFRSPENGWLTGIRAILSDNEKFRVGYALVGTFKLIKIMIISIGFAFPFMLLLAKIFRTFGAFTSEREKILLALLTFGIGFAVLVTPIFAYGLPLKRRYHKEIKQILKGTAESIGLKQVTPFSSSWFQLTTVDLEED
jgi:hypothetical protein